MRKLTIPLLILLFSTTSFATNDANFTFSGDRLLGVYEPGYLSGQDQATVRFGTIAADIF
ncbi:MAG: hypothetical protein H6625_02815 [Bdellovibrionaceae bacterium]|nr:hypothetical protein [Pseudobdellovibrionaceae bacterium]